MSGTGEGTGTVNPPATGAGAPPPEDKNKPGAAGGEPGKEGAGGEGADDLAGLSQEQLAKLVKDLRKENANRRTTNKTLEERMAASEEVMGKLKQALGIEKDEVSPEEKIQQLDFQNSAMQLEMGIRELAIEHGISKDQFEYFQFLFHKQLEGLEEGAELTEEQLSAVIAKARANGQPVKTSTGIGNDGGNPPPPSGGAGDVTVEKFAKMNPGEKGALYQKNPTLYNRLFTEAQDKRLL